MQSDYISIISLGVSLISASIAYIVFNFNRNEAKKRTVYHMHQLWSSEYYRKCRVEAYNGVTEKAKSPPKVLLSSINKTDLGTSLGTVEHFFGDLYHLMSTGSLDDKLARKLFSATVKAYFDNIFSSIEYDEEAEINYFKNNVEPLAQLMKEAS